METIVKGMDGIEEAATIIQRGGLVAFPTETVYGLGGNALDPDASRKIYAAKGRPSDNPLIVHVSCIEEVEPLVSAFPKEARLLMETFWPGPLTIILPKAEIVPHETTGGLDTVALRCRRTVSHSGLSRLPASRSQDRVQTPPVSRARPRPSMCCMTFPEKSI